MIWVLLCAVPVACMLAWLRLRWLLITVTGPSMQPTLQPGDRVLIRRVPVRRVRVGQIVVLTNELGFIIKRVAAVPDDPIPSDLTLAGNHVPTGQLVLIGDNLNRSVDSRTHGYYEGTNLVGVAVLPLRWRKR